MRRDKEDRNGYSPQELVSVMDICPTFACPHCKKANWLKMTTIRTTPTRLWLATTPCISCEKNIRWMLDPDRTVALQSDQMHRPIGF